MAHREDAEDAERISLSLSVGKAEREIWRFPHYHALFEVSGYQWVDLSQNVRARASNTIAS